MAKTTAVAFSAVRVTLNFWFFIAGALALVLGSKTFLIGFVDMCHLGNNLPSAGIVMLAGLVLIVFSFRLIACSGFDNWLEVRA